MRDNLGRQMYLFETPSQTAGPYVHIGLAPGAAGFHIYDRELGHDIAGPEAAGERIRVEGLVIDGTGSPVKDALIEVWQADAAGRHAHPEDGGTLSSGFRGWGRAVPDFESGLWSFETVKPGQVRYLPPRAHPSPRGVARGRSHGEPARHAPHISFWLIARGINLGLHTRMYFDDEAEANAEDPVLRLIEWERRRSTLVARRSEGGATPVYRFDIRLQGDEETVFFDV
jgi:protocatechuate 3,4-dioxygenase alpha subunit